MPVIPLPVLDRLPGYLNGVARQVRQRRGLTLTIDAVVTPSGLDVTIDFTQQATTEKVIDWGDTNSETSSLASVPHTYGAGGTYSIVVTIDGEQVYTEDVTVS